MMDDEDFPERSFSDWFHLTIRRIDWLTVTVLSGWVLLAYAMYRGWL